MAAQLPAQPELLMSWKEIATYLGKGVRTVQRWEQLFGLPVRRLGEHVKGPVQVTRKELDLWLSERWSQRRNPGNGNHFVDGGQMNGVRASIQCSAKLRRENRILVEDMQAALSGIYEECQRLTKALADPLKAA